MKLLVFIRDLSFINFMLNHLACTELSDSQTTKMQFLMHIFIELCTLYANYCLFITDNRTVCKLRNDVSRCL